MSGGIKVRHLLRVWEGRGREGGKGSAGRLLAQAKVHLQVDRGAAEREGVRAQRAQLPTVGSPGRHLLRVWERHGREGGKGSAGRLLAQAKGRLQVDRGCSRERRCEGAACAAAHCGLNWALARAKALLCCGSSGAQHVRGMRGACPRPWDGSTKAAWLACLERAC